MLSSDSDHIRLDGKDANPLPVYNVTLGSSASSVSSPAPAQPPTDVHDHAHFDDRIVDTAQDMVSTGGDMQSIAKDMQSKGQDNQRGEGAAAGA